MSSSEKDMSKREVVADARDVRGDARDVRGDKRDSTADKREDATNKKAEGTANRLERVVNLILLALFVNAVLGGIGIARNIGTNEDVDTMSESVGVLDSHVSRLSDQVESLDKFARDLAAPDSDDAARQAELEAVFKAVFDIRAAVCADNPVPECDDMAAEIIMTQINQGGTP